MKRDKETKANLLASARAEFLEKGYLNASLRNICKNAGVTTGALYFFFQDKADLYESLVKDTVHTIDAAMKEHFAEEKEQAQAGAFHPAMEVDASVDVEAAKRVLHFMYEHRDEVLMLLTKSQGSPYEGVLDVFIETAEDHLRNLAGQMEKAYPEKKIDDRLIHWLSHQQIEMFVYMITHIEDERQAVTFMEQSVSYMVTGWFGLFRS